MLRLLEKYNKLSFLIAITIGVIIFYFSSLSYDPVPSISFPLKSIIYHIGIFFLFCFFLMVGLSKGSNINWLFFAVLLSFFYGVTDELHQYFVPGRSVSVGDFLIDGLGIAFAFILYYISLEVRNGKGF